MFPDKFNWSLSLSSSKTSGIVHELSILFPETSLLSTLEPNRRISCDIGMFNLKTSAVEFHPDVTLEIVENNPKKKCLIVRHIEGPLPTSATEAEFKVDWGMLSSVKKL